MHHLFWIAALTLSAHSTDLTSYFTIAPPSQAAACENILFRRADRLAEFERLFPEQGKAFRKNFRWSLINYSGKRQLLGVPHKEPHDPPVFVVVPLDREENQSILTVTIHPRNPNLDFTLAREAGKLGRVLSLVHRFPRHEFGIDYPAGSLDIVLFETPSVNNEATLGQVMDFASTMAALCPLKDTRKRIHLVTE